MSVMSPVMAMSVMSPVMATLLLRSAAA